MECDKCGKRFIDTLNGLAELTAHKLFLCEKWTGKLE